MIELRILLYKFLIYSHSRLNQILSFGRFSTPMTSSPIVLELKMGHSRHLWRLNLRCQTLAQWIAKCCSNGWPPVLFVYIRVLRLSWINNNITCLIESEPMAKSSQRRIFNWKATFTKAPNESPNIWPPFARKFVNKTFLREPNRVTLVRNGVCPLVNKLNN